MTMAALDLDRLLKLRLIVARFGEMDLAKWWNTRGQLGRLGASALRRGFPRTHFFAQARSVFAVARARCAEVFEVPQTVTLWQLPEAVEESFEARWETWLDHAAAWTPFFDKLAAMEGSDLAAILSAFEVVGENDLQAYARLHRSPDAPVVALPGPFSGSNAAVGQLALGFGRGAVSDLVIPYANRA